MRWNVCRRLARRRAELSFGGVGVGMDNAIESRREDVSAKISEPLADGVVGVLGGKRGSVDIVDCVGVC